MKYWDGLASLKVHHCHPDHILVLSLSDSLSLSLSLSLSHVIYFAGFFPITYLYLFSFLPALALLTYCPHCLTSHVTYLPTYLPTYLLPSCLFTYLLPSTTSKTEREKKDFMYM